MPRLLFAILLLLLSLLVVTRAPLNFLWLVSVAVTNFPYIFMALTLCSLAAAPGAKNYRPLLMVINLVALVLYSLPVISAQLKNKQLPSELEKIFPSAGFTNGLAQPFTFTKMLTGIGLKLPGTNTLVYKIYKEQQLTLDFYPSQTRAVAPVVIVIHGGSWKGGDSKQLASLNSYLAGKGYHVASINYRLAPAYQSPAPVEDCRDAIDYLIAQAAVLKIDTSNIILLGRSAGGQIALVAAYSEHRSAIKGVISLYSPADMIWGGQAKTNQLVLNTKIIYHDYFGGVYTEVPGKFREASACVYVDSASPPTLIIHGKIDPLVSYTHSVHLKEKLDQFGIRNYFLSLPFDTHGCDYNINGPSGQLTTYAIERFIYSLTK